MKRTFFLLVVIFISFHAFSQQYIISFDVKNKEEISKLPKYVSVDNYKDNHVTAYIYGDKNMEDFKTLGYHFELLPHPAEGKVLNMATTTAQMSGWDRYPTHSVYLQMMNNFATNYPDICRLETIGTTVEGRSVLVLKITDNPDVEEQEPEFYYTGQMHGDELVGGLLFLRLIDYLLSNYGSISRVTNLVDNYEIWINPYSNPDGTYAGGDNTVSGATRGNANGIDLNRNFPSPNYQSPSGQNQLEIQMQIAFAESNHFVMSANSHSGEEVVNYPWDSWLSSTKKHPDHNWWDHVSHNYADEVHLNAPSTYLDGYDNGVTHGGDWYVVDGSRQDNMGFFKYCREVTLELSMDKMLNSDSLQNHWIYNRDAMLGYIEECSYGFNGTVKNINGNPLNAKIEISSHDQDNSEVYTDPEIGDYYRPIEPGTYNVTYSSEGYISQTHSVTVADWETTTIKNVVLLLAPQVTLTGTVIDATNSQPIQGATISLPGTSYGSVTTNASGVYSITIAENEYDISVYKAGYAMQTITETIDENNSVVDFALLPTEAITFEEGIPTEITFSGNANWFLSTNEAYEGTHSMESGDIYDEESSTMILTATTESGSISFYKKVSSEANYDFLTFYIDNVEQDSWSGQNDWSLESYPITAGSHTFKWTYDKDQNTSSGSDCGWVDYIELPMVEITTYSVTFTVLEDVTPIQSANVNLVGYGTLQTNSSGQCVFNDVVESGDSLSYNVSAVGYLSEAGKVLVDQNISKTVYLTPTVSYDVTFVVKEGEVPIENAYVSLNGYGTLQTDVDGECVFSDVSDSGDSIIYTIYASGYVTKTGKVLVDNDIIEVVYLSKFVSLNDIIEELSVYPNPSTGLIYVKTNSNVGEITIFSVNGTIVKQIEIVSEVSEIDLSSQSEGVYFIKLSTEKGNVFKKLVLE
ncbi:MAG: carboxypeptidase regulatory-like domain-containing protein [Bacteroidales bacterium]|nr:carboxypeptidase regulatory-like domain-containing protein [Bacteroidales bacterium]